MKVEYGEPKEVITKEVTYPNKKFIAFDGKEFTHESKCRTYEAEIKNKLQVEFYKKYYDGKYVELKTTEDGYRTITFKNQEEFNCIYGFLEDFTRISLYGHSTNEVKTYPPILKGITFPITFLAYLFSCGDSNEYVLIPLNEMKKNLESDLKLLEGL